MKRTHQVSPIGSNQNGTGCSFKHLETFVVKKLG